MTDAALVAAHAARVHAPCHSLEVCWDGLAWTDESAWVVSMRGVESVDARLGQANASEVDVELDNSGLRYSAGNASSPLHPNLSHAGHRVRVSLGYNGILALVGTYWVEDLAPSEASRTASMRLLDRAALLAERTVSYGPAGSVRTDDVLRAMLSSAGLVEGADFSLGAGDRTCRFAAAVNAPLLGELQAVAFAEGGRLAVAPDGTVTFLGASAHRAALASPVATLTRSEVAYDAPRVRVRDGSVNRVLLEYEDREQAVADEVVYDQRSPLAIPPAVQYTAHSWTQQTVEGPPGVFANVFVDHPFQAWSPGQVSLRVAGMDMTRWERSLPLQFTTVSACAAYPNPGGTGSPLALSWSGAPSMAGFSSAVSAVWAPGGSVGYLTFYNQSAATAYVTSLRLNGRPARTVAPFAVIADDPEAQLDGVVEESIRNAYLPDTDAAADRARDYLFFRSGLRARVNPTLDGCPFLHPLDAFALVDDSVAPPATDYLQVLSNTWSYSESAGYTCELKTGPALPSTTSRAVDSAPAPADAAPATASDSGPWTWDGAHPLAWTWSQWG
jgi:hypothetical protein